MLFLFVIKKLTKTQRRLTAKVHLLFKAPPVQKNTLCTNHTPLSSPLLLPPLFLFFFFVRLFVYLFFFLMVVPHDYNWLFCLRFYLW